MVKKFKRREVDFSRKVIFIMLFLVLFMSIINVSLYVYSKERLNREFEQLPAPVARGIVTLTVLDNPEQLQERLQEKRSDPDNEID